MTSPDLPAKPSVQTLRAGSTLYRAHNVDFGPIFFGPSAGTPPQNRFDSPDGSYGVCYLGLSEEAAFVEGVIHRAIPRRIISHKTLAARAISVVQIVKHLRVVCLYGEYLIGNGATAAVVHGDDYRGLSQPWSRTIHEHPIQADGILYTAKHDDSVMALALFDRAAHKIAAGARFPLSGRDLRTLRLLDRYGLGLEP